jgi:hypothetical protein
MCPRINKIILKRSSASPKLLRLEENLLWLTHAFLFLFPGNYQQGPQIQQATIIQHPRT